MEPKVVEGIGTIVISENTTLVDFIENAMVQAILDCIAEGITDPDIIRARQLAAKDKVNG